MKKNRTETDLMHVGEDPKEYKSAVVPPIYQNTLFVFDGWDALDKAFDDKPNQLIYSRGNNPSVALVAQKIAALAKGEKAQLFPSGMAAITAACMHYLRPGDHVIAINNIYGPAYNLLENYLSEKMNITTSFVNGTEISDFEKALRDNTRLIYLESPSSVVFSLQDIESVVKLAKAHNIKTIIDNTWATPLLQQPLTMGVDLEVHSTSKYLGGHSDLIGGVVIGKTQDINSIFSNEYELIGMKTAPIEAWLLLRSLRTLAVRMRQHQESALQIAQFLDKHPKVIQVNYPGLETFPQHRLAQKQMKGCSGLLSFHLRTRSLKTIKSFVKALQIFQIGVSWGGHESLLYMPAVSYMKELDEVQYRALGIAPNLMRISVGLEHVDDLITDLEQALKKIKV